MAGEYTAAESCCKGVRAFLERYGRLQPLPARRADRAEAQPQAQRRCRPLGDSVHARPPGFCTGCPERPIFSAMKLVERELGAHHVSADIGCHLFSILPPFNIGNTTMGYGLGAAGAAAFNAPAGKRAISVMGDGGFWHNGLTSGIANAVFNRSDNLTIVVDNNYTSATGGQDILSSTRRATRRAAPATRSSRRCAASASKWVKTIRRTYDVAGMRDALREALTTQGEGPEGPDRAVANACSTGSAARSRWCARRVADGERVVRERFGVDCRHLHRRPLLHPPLGLPVAVDQAQPRSAAHRPGRHRARQLRRLRRVRRGLACGRAVPVVLQARDRQQPERAGTGCASALRARGDRLAAAARRAPARAPMPSERP